MAILKTEGIVLKSFDYRETSRIATFFTKEYGKVSGVLKGIRTDNRKFGSSVDRFSVNDIVYYQYRNSDLHLVSQCDLKQFFYHISQDYKKSLAANYATELVNVVMPPEQRNRNIYQLMLNFFEGLADAEDLSQLVHMFQIKILLFSGFRPHLDACLSCQKKIEGKARFNLKDGGLVCLDCHQSSQDYYDISRGTVASLLHIERYEWAKCLQLKFTPTVRKELKYMLNHFLVFHLGRRLKTARFMNMN